MTIIHMGKCTVLSFLSLCPLPHPSSLKDPPCFFGCGPSVAVGLQILVLQPKCYSANVTLGILLCALCFVGCASMSQVLHECPPVTLVVQQHMSAHFNARPHKKICISIAFPPCLIFFNFHDSQIHHRTLKLHRCLIIKALHQSTNTPTLSVRNASNMCALSSRVQAKNLCKGRREDHPE